MGFAVGFIYLSMDFASETRKDDLLEEKVVDEGDKNNVKDDGEYQLGGYMRWISNNMKELLQEAISSSMFINV